MTKNRHCLPAGGTAIIALLAIGSSQGFAQTQITPDPSSFSVRNYRGKCLDYGQRRHHPFLSQQGPAVYLNDCALAHPIRVEEITPNDRHEVILHAGTKVLGITKPLNKGVTEIALELQDQAAATTPSAVDQVFALDGDSIILASSRPCVSTDFTLCPQPPPQLVVQIQNARGANGSPIVVAPRNLAASEFWDFNALDGSGRYPTHGFVQVATNHDLWNTICADPVARVKYTPAGPVPNPAAWFARFQ